MNQQLSKAKASILSSLSIKKYREEHRLFLVEGFKIIEEVLKTGMEIRMLVGLPESLEKIDIDSSLKFETDQRTMEKLSNFNTASAIMAAVAIPRKELNISDLSDSLTMAIDTVQDPGNFGTIIRICDWFGIRNIVCSNGSTDLYNPKVVQSTMGAFTRVNIFYADLPQFIADYRQQTGLDCFGTFLEGDNIYAQTLPQNGLIVMGNEGKGISPEVEAKITRKLFIPPFHDNHVESLNISMAAAIVCNEFRRGRMS